MIPPRLGDKQPGSKAEFSPFFVCVGLTALALFYLSLTLWIRCLLLLVPPGLQLLGRDRGRGRCGSRGGGAGTRPGSRPPVLGGGSGLVAPAQTWQGRLGRAPLRLDRRRCLGL